MQITKRRWLRLAATTVALLLWLPVVCVTPAASSSGPAPYALIFGTVWGSGERPVYGTRVKLRRAEQSKFRWEAISDHRGEFAIRVPAGKADYVLIPETKHAKNKSVPETRIHVEKDERVDIGVHLEE